MQVELSEFTEYMVIAGNGNNLHRYKVKGDKLHEVYSRFERVCYIGEIACFECYVKNPQTSEGGWDIVFIEGVKEKIKRYYPHFDEFITRDYPSHCKPIEFFQLDYDDYELAELI